jgi:hypothetical protein
MTVPQGANQRSSFDFVSDQFSSERRFRIVTMVPDFTKVAWRWSQILRCERRDLWTW